MTLNYTDFRDFETLQSIDVTWLLSNILLVAIGININWREEPGHARFEDFEVIYIVKIESARK